MGRNVIFPAVLIALAAWWVADRYLRRRSNRAPDVASPMAGISRHDLKALRVVCRGDDSRAQRLIEYEKARAPGITNQQACTRAIERFRRDNR